MVKGAVCVGVWCVVVLMVVAAAAAAAHARETTAENCNPLELKMCAPAIFNGEKPSAECCKKLKEQQPCFCEYANNPILKPIVNGPNAGKILAACSVKPPICTE